MIAAFHGLSFAWRAASVIGFVFVVWASAAVFLESQKMKGEARVIERSKTQGKINETKARKAHERARAPGAPERVQSRFCRDCD